jgi:hypothetical protein
MPQGKNTADVALIILSKENLLQVPCLTTRGAFTSFFPFILSVDGQISICEWSNTQFIVFGDPPILELPNSS